MNSISDFLADLSQKNIKVWVDGGQLRIRGAKEALTEDVTQALKARKEEILRFLAGPASIAGAEPILPVSRDTPLALSYAQQRLWFLDQMGSGFAYNMPFPLRLRGTLDAEALRQALGEIVRRHESLRTTFAEREGQPVQIIKAAPAALELPLFDLSHLPEAAREAEAQAQAQAEAQRPFDLGRDLMLRGRLLRLADGEHVLLLTLHHIAADGWSVEVLVRELTALYDAYTQGQPSPLPPLAVQYADFAAWQRQWLQGEALERQLGYWKTRLDGAPALLELPTDRPRRAVESFRGEKCDVRYGVAVTAALKTLSRNTGTTLFTTLLAAFQTLLARYSGQDNIVVGIPTANRNRLEIEPLIGFFVNTLPMRVDLSDNPAFRDVLEQAKQAVHTAQDHQDLPFERLVEALKIERDLSHNPLVQTMFALQTAQADGFALRGVEATRFDLGWASVRFDLELHLWERDGGLSGFCLYAADLFDGATIARMMGHFGVLLDAIAANPDQAVRDLPLLTGAEREQILVGWNATASPYPDSLCLHQLFERQARRSPDATALAYQGREVSYAELDARANRLAHALRKLGVEPGQMVALCVERSVELIVAVLGVLKAGGTCLPLDPGYPAERLSYMREHAGAVALLVGESLRERIPPVPGQALFSDWDGLDLEPSLAPDCPARPDTLAYCLYTSGSTGRPKGVAMPHRALVNLVAWQLAQPGFDKPARTLQFSPISFDVSFQETFTSLASGGTLILMDEELRRDSPALLGYLDSQRVDRLFLPFVALQALADAARGRWPASLADVVTSGEQLQITGAIAACFQGSPCRLHNQYGPTETHVVAAHTLEGPADGWPKLPPIGRPIANTHAYILDARRRLQPVGVPGELHIGGACLADGYLRQPEATAERFIANPFGEGLIYRSGDLARWLPEGHIEFLGRIDAQVKIRGFRIEPGEIEAVLAMHPAVREAVVAVHESRPGEKRLAAYAVAHVPWAVGGVDKTFADDGAAAAAVLQLELSDFLKSRLPDYMVPSSITLLDALPLTPSGKLDRAALPAPDAGLGVAAFAAPQTPSEQTLAAIWAELLRLEQVGRLDNFFALGGHSLLATQLVSRLRDALEVNVSVRAVFERPRLADLAAYLDALRGQGQNACAEEAMESGEI